MPYETVGDLNQRKIITPDTMTADKAKVQAAVPDEDEKNKDPKMVPLDQRRSS